MQNTESTVFVTGADRGLGLGLCSVLLEKGWRVVAGKYLEDWPELDALSVAYPDRLHCIPLDISSIESVYSAAQSTSSYLTLHNIGALDLLINNAGIISPMMNRTIHERQDYTEMHRMFDVNALGSLRVVEAFLPLLTGGELKRLCFISSEAGSIERQERDAWFGYCMSKAALNMAVKILFNDLRPEGFTFRVYHPGWVRSYMSGSKNLEAHLEPIDAAKFAVQYFLPDLSPDEEDCLVLKDYQGNTWPW